MSNDQEALDDIINNVVRYLETRVDGAERYVQARWPTRLGKCL